MKNRELSELNLEELYEKKKVLKWILIVFACLMLVACAGVAYYNIESGNTATFAIIPACFVSLLPISNNLGSVNKEIRDREAR